MGIAGRSYLLITSESYTLPMESNKTAAEAKVACPHKGTSHAGVNQRRPKQEPIIYKIRIQYTKWAERGKNSGHTKLTLRLIRVSLESLCSRNNIL